MADSTFLASDFLRYPNLNLNHTNLMDYHDPLPEFELSDYLIPEAAGSEEDSTATHIGYHSQNPVLPGNVNEDLIRCRDSVSRSSDMKCKSGMKKIKVDAGFKIAFRTKTELEIMDDGFKWRKYGKKLVKNSPNPRNYYRCSNGGCNVKKRVERDREDFSYVITTYEGVHNHESPCVVYYNQMPLMIPSGWTLEASHSSS